MASSISPQSARVPLGYVDAAGGRMPVYIAPEWYRFITVDMVARVGGFEADTNTELADMIGGDGSAPPPAPPAPPADDLAPPALVLQPDDAPHGRLEALEAEVFRLRQMVEALTQGTTQ